MAESHREPTAAERLATVDEAAAALQISVRTLLRLVQRQQVPCHRFGRALRFDLNELRRATRTPVASAHCNGATK